VAVVGWNGPQAAVQQQLPMRATLRLPQLLGAMDVAMEARAVRVQRLKQAEPAKHQAVVAEAVVIMGASLEVSMVGMAQEAKLESLVGR
tara:strand:+ start:776 stop:1042 length:267 start_codon:yes stop_codon:yes gene_type:complete